VKASREDQEAVRRSGPAEDTDEDRGRSGFGGSSGTVNQKVEPRPCLDIAPIWPPSTATWFRQGQTFEFRAGKQKEGRREGKGRMGKREEIDSNLNDNEESLGDRATPTAQHRYPRAGAHASLPANRKLGDRTKQAALGRACLPACPHELLKSGWRGQGLVPRERGRRISVVAFDQVVTAVEPRQQGPHLLGADGEAEAGAAAGAQPPHLDS